MYVRISEELLVQMGSKARLRSVKFNVSSVA